MANKKEGKVHGSLYQRNGRWWWRVKLPGEDKFKARPLIPLGGQCAYKGDRKVAVEIAEAMWHAAIFKTTQDTNPQFDGTITSLVRVYLTHADATYRKVDGSRTRYPEEIRETMRPLIEFCGMLSVDEFTLHKLKELREYMAGLTRKGKDKMVRPRYCLRTLNKKIKIIKGMFRWASEEGYVHPSTYHGLQVVRSLRPGQYGLIENPQVQPVQAEHMLAVLPYTTKVVADMIQLQYITGMRSIELTGMKPRDIDRETEEGIWLYNVPQIYNKNARHGEKHKRIVPIGPKAQTILLKYLLRDKNSFCFSPIESEKYRREKLTQNRKTPLSYGNSVGTNRKDDPEKKLGDVYDTHSYRRAVQSAITAARKAIKDRGGDPDMGLPMWTPYQLRHSAATNIAKTLSLDTARAVLGHRSLEVTKIYAQEDIKEIAKKYKQIG